MKGLEKIVTTAKSQRNPPVHLWKPDHCGDIDIYIDEQGRWFHEGAPIVRESMVKLFASVLWSEGDDYFLVTPVEKMRIKVDDVPFIMVTADYIDKQWKIKTNTGNECIIGKEHPVKLRLYHDQWLPYVRIRYDLWARVSRSVYQQWCHQILISGSSTLQLSSGDYSFDIAQ